jgi:hypothetical protein
MRRREFGSTAAWPLVARAQQSAVPIIAGSAVRSAHVVQVLGANSVI